MAATGALGLILLQRLPATSPAISSVECCSGLADSCPSRASTRSTLALSPVRNSQFGASTPCWWMKSLRFSGVSFRGSLVRLTKVLRLARSSPRAARTSQLAGDQRAGVRATGEHHVEQHHAVL